LFYKFNLVTVDKLSENRDLVKNMFKDKLKTLPNEEIIYLTKMIQILEIILDLTDSRLGLEY
jgi:ribosomal protein S17E